MSSSSPPDAGEEQKQPFVGHVAKKQKTTIDRQGSPVEQPVFLEDQQKHAGTMDMSNSTTTTTSSSDPPITDEHDKYFTVFVNDFDFSPWQKNTLLRRMKAANFRHSTLDKLTNCIRCLPCNFTYNERFAAILNLCAVIYLLPDSDIIPIRPKDLVTALRQVSTGTDAQRQIAEHLVDTLDGQQKRAATANYVTRDDISDLEHQISHGFAASSPQVLTPQHLDTLFNQIHTFMDDLSTQCYGTKTRDKINILASHPGIAVPLSDVHGILDWSKRRDTQRSFTSHYSSYSSSSQHDASHDTTPLKEDTLREDTLKEDTLTLSAGTTLLLVSTLHIIYLMRGHELLPGGLTKENREAAFELLSSFQRAIPTNPVDKSSNHVLMAGIPGFDKSLLHVILFTLLFHHKIDVALVSAASDEHLMCMHYRYSPTTQQGVIDANLPLRSFNPSSVIVLIDHRDYNADQSVKPYYIPQLEQFVHRALYNYQQHPPLLMSLRTSFFESPGRAPARARSVLGPIIYGLPSCSWISPSSL